MLTPHVTDTTGHDRLHSRAATAPPATTDSATRSQWLTRDTAARLAIRNHLPLTECAHFRQHRTAQALYATLVACYSSPATAALGRLLLPYLFPELSAFATVEDLVSHLRTSDARYRATVPAEFLDRNQPLMFITLYFIVTRLPDSFCSVRDHFLSLDPTSLTVDLLEQHLLATETSAVAVGAARGTPRPPFFEGISVAEDVGAASASAKRRRSKGKGGKGGGGGIGGGGGGSGSSGGGSSGGGGSVGTGGGSGGSGGGGGGSGGSGGTGGSGGSGTGGGGTGTRRVGSGGGRRQQQQQRRSETQSPQQLHLRAAPHSAPLLLPAQRRDTSVFRVWGSRAFVRDTSADKLSPRAIPCVFLGFVPDAPGWQFYHPTSRRVFRSQDFTFDESVPFYRLFPYRSAPPPPPPLFLAPGTPPVAVSSGAARGAASGGAEPWGADSEGAGSGGAEPVGVEPEGAEPGGAESEGAESGGAEPRGASSSEGPAGASPRLSQQQLGEWFVRRAHPRSGATGAEGARDAGAGGTGGTAATGPGGARTRGTGAAGTGGVEGAGAGDPTGLELLVLEALALELEALELQELELLTLELEVLGVPSSTGLTPPLLCPLSDQSQLPLQLASPLPAPSPYTEHSGGPTERREPASHPVSPVRTARRVPHLRPPPVPGTHAMELRPSSSDRARAASPTVARLLATAVTDPSFESSTASALVAELLDFAAACRLDYATALVAESAFASPPSVGGDPDAPDIPTPRSYAEAITVDGMWIFRVKRPPGSPPAFKARYVARGFSQRQGVDYFQTFSPTPKMTTLWVLLHVAAQRDYELHSLDFSIAFLQGSLHKEIWLRRPPGFTKSFPAGTQWSLRRLVYGLRHAPCEWHDTVRTTLAALGVAPATADPSLFLRTDTSLSLFYVLFYVDDLVFATADTEALTLVKSELHKRHTCTDLGELRSYLGLLITRDRARRTITLTQSHMVHQVLQRFGFQFSSPQLTPLSTNHLLSAPPSDESVESSGPYPELVGCLMYLMTCTRHDLAYPLSLLACYVAPGRHRKVHWDAAKRVLRYLCSTSGMGLVLGGRGPVVLTGHANASWVDDSATQRSSQGYTFSLGFGSVSWRSARSSLVLSSSCEAEIYAGAMAAQELRWLTYVLTDLGEQPRSPLVLYVDNKAMIALCQEHRLEHRTKHIALRYFLARELQQRGQLRLAYVATRANTADIFTKALPPGDHQRFSTMLSTLSLLCFLDWSCDHLFSPTLRVGVCQKIIAFTFV
ncbi:unnamed protein product [Closterium sp. NIES-54]